MPIVAVNIVKVLFAVALYGFLFYVARAMRGHIAGPRVDAAATPSLEVTQPGGSAHTYPIEEVVVLGRGESADIRLDDEYASDRHASFTREGTRLFLEDLGSTNGTTVDGHDVAGRIEVSPDSTIIVGRTKVRVR